MKFSVGLAENPSSLAFGVTVCLDVIKEVDPAFSSCSKKDLFGAFDSLLLIQQTGLDAKGSLQNPKPNTDMLPFQCCPGSKVHAWRAHDLQQERNNK
jgi:hypothetical protein